VQKIIVNLTDVSQYPYGAELSYTCMITCLETTSFWYVVLMLKFYFAKWGIRTATFCICRRHRIPIDPTILIEHMSNVLNYKPASMCVLKLNKRRRF